MDPDARFSEEEIQKILARAAQRQERADSAHDGPHTGLSLARLQEVAADVGIAPAHVEAAAREVVLHRDKSSGTVAGLPREVRALRSLPGTIKDAQWERMVAEFRKIFKKNGIPSQFGEVREWISTSEAGESSPVVVRIEPDGAGGMHLSVQQSIVSVASLALGLGGGFSGVGLLFGILVGMGVLESAAAAFAWFMVALGVLGGGAGWVATLAWSRSQQRAIDQAADRAELIARLEGSG